MLNFIPLSRISICIFLAFYSLGCASLGFSNKELPLDPVFKTEATEYKLTFKTNLRSTFPKYRFGSVKVTNGKAGWRITKRNSRIWSRNVETTTSSKFSFDMISSTDSASVQAIELIKTKTSTPVEVVLSDSWSVIFGDEDFDINESFLASISTSIDPEDDWLLKLKAVENLERYIENETILTNRDRTIQLKHINSPYTNNELSLPALGYEFIEDDRVIAAINYFPGKIAYRKVWLLPNLDKQTELVISAACIAINHYKGDID